MRPQDTRRTGQAEPDGWPTDTDGSGGARSCRICLTRMSGRGNRRISSAALAVVLAAAWFAGWTVQPVAAAPCPPAPPSSWNICNGTVSPTSGTPSTDFTFTVTYSRPTGGSAPLWVRVSIDGGNPVDMTAVPPIDHPHGN